MILLTTALLMAGAEVASEWQRRGVRDDRESFPDRN
jgi:hypothetical protein